VGLLRKADSRATLPLQAKHARMIKKMNEAHTQAERALRQEIDTLKAATALQL
jgi:hypothetical protein